MVSRTGNMHSALCSIIHMNKHYPSKLDSFADQLDHWFGVENMTQAQTIDRLHELGCDVSQGNLSHWCRVRRRQQWQEQLLHEITSGAQQCEQVEKPIYQDYRRLSKIIDGF